MQFPPPPELAFLAYTTGKISKSEYLHIVELWKEKHDTQTRMAEA